jgi:hypothetical protein
MWVRTGGLRMGMGFLGLGEVREVEVPEASRPDFIGVTIPRSSPSNVEDEGVELGASGRGG